MASGNEGRWSVERAREWHASQPWRVGCNFTPSNAINQLEMWQAESFDPETNDRELGWAAGLGMNLVRVYLHDLLWTHEPDAFLGRCERFLELAHGHGIATLFVLFDDVWHPAPQLGPQPEPFPGRHNSGWVQGPGRAALAAYAEDAALRERLESYVRGVVGRFASDERVFGWDVYNEPGGFQQHPFEAVGEKSLPLLRDTFAWARAEGPEQPLTSGFWNRANPESVTRVQAECSDIASFHHYGPVDELRETIDWVRGLCPDRPLVCTEFLAREVGSRFETHLLVFRNEGIHATCWGLVSGKTQTIYPWSSWTDEAPRPEPDPWFHDVLRRDGSPYDPDEAKLLREMLTTDT